MEIFSTTSAFIPNRSSFTTGSQFCQDNMTLRGQKREDNILKEFLDGNIPDFLKNFKPLTLTDGKNTLVILVMSDYLSIGNNNDYVRMPMYPGTAQKIADKYDCSLPTKKLVDEIYNHSLKLIAKPWGAPYTNMDATERYLVNNHKIQEQFNGLDFTSLVAGHKKDIVLTNRLAPNNSQKRVAIYGWFLKSGSPIQGLNAKDHHDLYVDYSHSARLICNDVVINGNLSRLQDIMTNPQYCNLVSDEGVMKFLRY